MIFYILSAFTVWMAVECVRRGQTNPWLWIILFIPTFGAAAYFFSEYVGFTALRLRPSHRASKRELEHARSEVRRLDNSESWTNYAQALRSRKQYREALEAAETAFAKDGASRRALYELGLARLGSERYPEAATALARLVEEDPGYDSGEARYALGVAYEKSGDKQSARRTLESLAKTTSLPKVLYRLASLQAEAGETARARETLERIIEESEYVPKYHRREVRPWVRKARRALATLPA
jgi:tetratricopeptide (TPR) repeat protein